MAKKTDDARPERGGKIRVRILEFDLEGGNSTLQESLRTLATSLRTNITSPQPARLNKPDSTSTVEEAPAEIDVIEPEEVIDEVLDADSLDNDDKPRKPRRYPSPEVIDIEFKPGAPTFQEFAEKYETDTVQNKYLIALAYLKEHTSHEQVTQNHIFTLFKLMKGWPFTRDFSQPLRNLKKLGYANSAETGNFSLNHVGENLLNRIELQG